jgi:hypothetical protein
MAMKTAETLSKNGPVKLSKSVLQAMTRDYPLSAGKLRKLQKILPCNKKISSFAG